MTIIGQVLNHRYEILEKIGEGGMATAYRGRDRVLGRVVAIKVMRPELASDAEFLSRFRREARAAAGITHEHIAGVYDTGQDGAHHYIVMEYIEGESLRDRLRRAGPLPLTDALRIATETAEALEAAHAAGIVHRDIKPHNILLGREGQVKVTDFGIARAISMSSHTETGKIIGSVNYISPEQARGEGVGPQADIYSLGVTLFEILTGHAPFDGTDRLAILHKHIYDQPPLISEFRAGVPAEVESIVDHCLEKDLSRRFASARELLSYLDICPRVEPQGWHRSLHTASRWRRFSRGVEMVRRRLRRHAGLLSLAILLLAAAVVVFAIWLPLRTAATTVLVPDVIGLGEAAAHMRLEGEELGYRKTGHKPSEDVDVNLVLSQDPPSGQRVSKGTVVKVVISDGSDQVVVPLVTEMALEQARMNLTAHGLAIGAVRESYDERIPRGYVRATFPATGVKVVKGTAVSIDLSLGPKPVVMPPPPLPIPPYNGETGHRETINYTVPVTDENRDTRVKVTIELEDSSGRRIIYEADHKPEESIPAQTFLVTKPTTVRILLNGTLDKVESYQP